MTESHQRHLLVTLRHIDNLLLEAERILTSAESASPFASYAQLETPLQRKVSQDYIHRVRNGLRRALTELDLPQPAPLCGTLWAARGHIAQASIAVADLESDRMRDYGALSKPDAEHIDGVAAELKALLDRLITYLGQDRDAGIQMRLQKLEPERDEVQLLRELERITTSHGLVEFRTPLTALLDALEKASFEIGIFGRVKSGKSSLLNFLLGVKVLPKGVTPVTAIPTRVRYGPTSRARIEFAQSPPIEIELGHLAEYSTEQRNPANVKQVSQISVEVPAERLRDGVTFVDTPGLGSLATGGAKETRAYLPRCDLGLVLVDAASTLTREDLMLVEALQSTARAMVVVSKCDLLSSEDLERTMSYMRQQLRTHLGADVPLYAISVAGDGAPMCEYWFESQLEPIFKNHREQLATSLKRKIRGLCGAVIKTLEVRQGQRVAGPAQEGALLGLRQGDAVLKSSLRTCEGLVDHTPSLHTEMVTAGAAALALAWEKQSDPAKALSAAVVSALTAHTAKLVSVMDAARQELEQTLALGHTSLAGSEATPDGARDGMEPLPKPASLPLFDPTIVTAAIHVPKPPALPPIGALLRRYAASRLQAPMHGPLTKFLNEYTHRLRLWLRQSMLELSNAFNARAVPLRAQLEVGSASGFSEGESDLRQLREWLA